MLRTIAFALAVLAAFVGCSKPEIPPPVLSIANRSCDVALDFGKASPLVLEPKSDSETNKAEFNMAQSTCLELPDGKKIMYGLVALPKEQSEYLVSVESQPIGEGVFAPVMSMLDEKGRTLRTIAKEAMVFRGGALSALLRSHPGDRYMLVVSDVDAIGKSFSRTIQGTQASGGYMVGYTYVQTYLGFDATQKLTYSYNGTVVIAVEPLRKPSIR